MCMNVFMPFIDKYITIGGEGGGGYFKWKLHWGEKGWKETLINWKHLTKAIVNEMGVEGIDFSSLLLLYLTLNETQHMTMILVIL